jgi:hypothetical protein
MRKQVRKKQLVEKGKKKIPHKKPKRNNTKQLLNTTRSLGRQY